ncbi:uncharacterized protein FPRO_13685 [Fusarium proliferatum ET1]|uniref:Uncharacterized protein n=1 Tax=Fusarium proliferatum (strain ET1) TaxID=1227346 RepID=A0A1L7VTZ4_FUSPR|nr:uncharacterized protein FPRO_13685 [Fusarium proliferatum ET1]
MRLLYVLYLASWSLKTTISASNISQALR